MKHVTIDLLKSKLSTTIKVCILGHKNPDGDALGSTLGLALFFKEIGIDAQVIMPNGFPDFLKWLPSSESVLLYDQQKDKCENELNAADIVFTLDFNHLSRTGDMQAFLEQLDADFAMIDHHEQPSNYAKYMLVNTQIASTCELVHEFITTQFPEEKITADVASCLYTGIMTDTGSFRFPSTTSKTHRIIAELIDAGAQNAQIHQQTFDANSFQRLQLLGSALNNMVQLSNYKTAFTYLDRETLQQHNYKKGDTEGFVNYGLSIKDIVFAVIFIESLEEDLIKISFRSKGDFDVNAFARNYFEGGGHKNAAGGRSFKNLTDTIAYFKEKLSLHHN